MTDGAKGMIAIAAVAIFIGFPILNENEADAGKALTSLTVRKMERQLAGMSGAEYLKEKAIFESGVVQETFKSHIEEKRRKDGEIIFRLSCDFAYGASLLGFV